MQPPTPARTLQGAEVGLEMTGQVRLLPLLSFLCPVSWPPLHPLGSRPSQKSPSVCAEAGSEGAPRAAAASVKLLSGGAACAGPDVKPCDCRPSGTVSCPICMDGYSEVSKPAGSLPQVGF